MAQAVASKMINIGIEKDKIGEKKIYSFYLDIDARKLGIVSAILTAVWHSDVGTQLAEGAAQALTNI